MKILKLATSCLLLGLGLAHADAAPIKPTKAVDIAQQFFSGSLRSITSSDELKITYVAPEVSSSDDFRSSAASDGAAGLYYIVNRGNHRGFVIVAGDDRVNPILAYADEGSIENEDLIHNVNLRYILGSYTRQMRQIVLNQPDQPADAFRAGANIPAKEIVVEPLLRYASDRQTLLPEPIAWGQAWPFNHYAPNIRANGKTYPTVSGCVATAISTVMRWHQWPRHPKGTLSYYWRGNEMTTTLTGKTYDWDQMPARISGRGVDYETGYKCTDDNADNIGRLLRDVGYAVKMGYDASFNGGSGAYTQNIIGPFVKNFGYKSQVRYINRSSYTARSWWQEVTDELSNYGPIIYVGHGGGGGHCFVLDGYAKYSRDYNYFVHVDWGWTGSQNGWYKIDVMEPGALGIGGGTGGGFPNHQAMVRYLEPDPSWEKDEEPKPRPEPNPTPVEEKKPFALELGKDPVSIKVAEGGEVSLPVTLKNSGKGDFNQLLKAYIVRRGVDPLKETQEVDRGEVTIAKQSSRLLRVEFDLKEVSPTLNAGHYELYLGYLSEEGYYVYMRNAQGKPAVCARLEITKPVTPKPQPAPVVEAFELGIASLWNGQLEPTANNRIAIEVKNSGNKAYFEHLALCLAKSEDDTHSTILAETRASINPGQTSAINFDVDLSAQEEGAYKLYVAYRNGIRYKSIESLAGELTIRRKRYALSLYSTPQEFSGKVGEKTTISLDVNNSGELDYSGSLGLYAVESGSTANPTLLISGNAKLIAGTHTRVNLYPNLPALKEGKSYDLWLSYHNDKGEQVWLGDNQGKGQPVATLLVLAKPKPRPIVSDNLHINRVVVYQNGVLKGESAPYVSYANGRGKFTARVYLSTKSDFSGDVRIFLTNPDGATNATLNSKAVTKRIRISKNTEHGYVDIEFTTKGFRDSYYNVGLKYYDRKKAQWITTTDKFPFLIDYSSAYGLDPDDEEELTQPTRGAVYDVVMTKPITIGSTEDEASGSDLTGSDALSKELDELGYAIFPTITEGDIEVKADKAGTAYVYDFSGKLVMQIELERGINATSVASLAQGNYVMRIDNKTLRFVRR